MNRDLTLRVEGALTEKLIQRALRQGASFARLQRSGTRALLVQTNRAGAEILASLCEKYGYDCRILRRGGLAAARITLRRRWTLALGLLLCIGICIFALTRIWMIDIAFTGPSASLGDGAALRAAIEGAGVRIGMPTGALDTELMQRRLLAEMSTYSFVGVRRQGVRLLIEAAPEVPAPEVYDLERARDLVAARDGVVEKITVHSGSACVKVGDTVRAGQLLIRGEEAKTKEETAPVGALGEVIARCWTEGSAEGALTQARFRRTGQSEEACRLRLLDYELTLTSCAGYPSEEVQREILPIVGLFLPLEMEKRVHFETVELQEPIARAQLEAQLCALARADARSKLARADIRFDALREWVELSEAQERLHVRMVCEMSGDIAVARDALR